MSDITQSNIDRQNILNNPFALEKIQQEIKNFPYFQMEGKIFILKQDVAEFYQVSEDTIDRVLNENEQELRQNGYEILTGKRLKIAKSQYVSDNNVGDLDNQNDFTSKADEIAKSQYVNRKLAGDLGDSKYAGSWGIFDFRAFLNVGMLLKNSLVAKELRSKILDIVVDVMRSKTGGKTKYINQRDDTFTQSYLQNKDYRKGFTDALKTYLSPELGNFKYPYFTDLIYKDLFGENAKEYRQLLKLGARENLRHTLYREMLDVVSGYENGITEALKQKYEELGRPLEQAESEEVFKLCFISPFLKPIKETARKLMASRDKAFREIMHEALQPYLSSLPEEEYQKFLSKEAQIIQEQTQSFVELLDKHEDIFKRLKDR
ncbi:MAG: DNA-binding protein [bacterium]